MEHLLSERVVTITGAFGHLGEALANLFAESGARLVLIDRSASQLPSSPTLLVLPGVDLTDSCECDDVMRRIEAHYGRLDALVNVVAGFAWEPALVGETRSQDPLRGLNRRAALNLSKAALPLLVQSPAGRIVNIGAGIAVKPEAGKRGQGTSQAAVLRLTEDLVEVLKSQPVTVNAVLSSILDTPQNRAALPGAEYERWVAPEQLSAVILFLLSDAAAHITGAGVLVSGRR